jgi:hypothetical protein
MKKVAYLTGPMSGHPNWNRFAFDLIEQEMTRRGFHVINPVSLGTKDTWLEYISRNVLYLALSDVVVVLPGWKQSNGSLIEIIVACKLGKKLIFI